MLKAIPDTSAAFTVKEFCMWANISVAHFYRQVQAGKVRMRKISNKSVVTKADAQAWLDALPVSKSAA